MVLNQDKEIIRDLTKKWMEIANLPVMAERGYVPIFVPGT